VDTQFERRDAEIIKLEPVFQGYFRVDRYQFRHRLFGGGWTGPVTREVFERGHSVAVLLYDPQEDAVVLIEQFRAGAFAAGMGPWLIECVAGIIDEGESPDEVARRESIEETGCTLARLERIGKFLYSTGACSEVCRLYIGEVDTAKAGGVHGLAAENEDIKTHIIPADDAIAALDTGTLDNAALIIAIAWLARHREALRRRWGVSDRSVVSE
jgi:ADP-ribose pyrophosphatase